MRRLATQRREPGRKPGRPLRGWEIWLDGGSAVAQRAVLVQFVDFLRQEDVKGISFRETSGLCSVIAICRDQLQCIYRKLEKVRRSDNKTKEIFTSDLSVDEFLLVKSAGFEPVGFEGRRYPQLLVEAASTGLCI